MMRGRVRRLRVLTLISILLVSISGIAVVLNKAKASTMPNIEVGYYDGDGNSSRTITLNTSGFGTSQMVMVQEAPASGTGSSGPGYMRIQGMSGAKSMGDGGSFICSTCITAVGTGTFDIGSTINVSGKRYGYTVVNAASGNFDDNFAVGSYAGDNTDNRNISLGGPTWNPDMLVIIKIGGAGQAIWRSSTHSGDLAASFNATADSANWIQSLSPSAGDFQIGNHANVNASGATYYWVAFKNLTGAITNGTYVGNVTNDRDITMTDAFRPDYLWTKIGGAQQSANHYIHQDAGNVGQIFIGNYNTNSINTSNSNGFRIDNSAYVNSNTFTYHYFALKSRFGGTGVTSTFNQSAYRLFGNANSADVGSALAATNTASVIPQQGTAFRLRMNVHISTSDLAINTQSFKLQVAARGVDNQCDTSFTNETYADVSSSSGAIRFYDNAGASEDANLTVNANDPAHSGHTNNAQTYNEANNFANNTSAITNGNDGLWDFALVDNSAANDATYCFRAVKSDGNVLDTYTVIPEITTSPAGTITITNPAAYKVFQRNGSNQANIALNGTYTGSPTAIEARWNGGSWTTIDAAPSGGTYSATLSNQSGGQGALEVRFSNATSITASQNYIGVGDVYVIAGDSNASGVGSNLQTYSHATLKAVMYKNYNGWGELVDPTDSSTGQNAARASYDSQVTDASTNRGSIWPLLATKIMADQNVPVAFVPAARWGSTVSGSPSLFNTANWRRWDAAPSNTANLYGDMWTKIGSIGTGIKGIVFHEAVNDINQVSDAQRANYKAQLNDFVNDIMTDFGVKTLFSLPGDCDPVLYFCDTPEGFDNVREVIKEVWNENANIIPGGIFYDIDKTSPLGDGVHFMADASLQKLADRVWLSLRDEYYTATDARGPQLTAAQYNAAKTDVYLTFTDASLPILPASGAEGIRIYDNGVQATISSVTRTANNTLKVSLSSAASGTITVSICEYRDCYGQTVITDSSTYNLPVENIRGQSTTLLSDTTAPTGTISINGGAPTTNTTSVTLTLSATDDIDPSGSLQMQVSNDSGFAGASWETYNTSKAWTLTSGVGVKTVYARFRDATNNTSGGYNDTITLSDNTAPTGSISVNFGNATTNNLNAMLTLLATDDMDSGGSLQIMVSNDAGFSGASWEAYSTSKAWTLSSGTGAKTVYVKYKDSSNNESGSYNDVITVVDNTAPTGMISINGGAATTNDTNVTLTLSSSDDFDSSGSLQMMVSNASDFSGASWEAYNTSKAWTLTSGVGTKTVYARFRDATNNTSSGYSDDIVVIENNDNSGGTSLENTSSGNSTNQSRTPNTSDGSGSQPSSTEQPTNDDIVLNDIDDYHSDQGYSIDTGQEESVKLWVGKNLHTITLKYIYNDRIVLLIQSEPQYISIKIGETEEIDIDKNGQMDISVSPTLIASGKVNIVYKAISNAKTPTPSKITDTQDDSKPENTVTKSNLGNIFVFFVLGIVMVVLLAIIIRVIKNKKTRVL